MTDYRGACHCGAMRYVYRCATQPADWNIRACQCTFCLQHGALSASEPGASIEFFADGNVSRYRFGLRTADFLLCEHCGNYLGAVIETDKGLFGIVNTRMLEEPLAINSNAAGVSYDGEDTAGRIARRIANWSPVTRPP